MGPFFGQQSIDILGIGEKIDLHFHSLIPAKEQCIGLHRSLPPSPPRPAAKAGGNYVARQLRYLLDALGECTQQPRATDAALCAAGAGHGAR